MGNSNEVTSERTEVESEDSDDEEIEDTPSEPDSPIRKKMREVDYTAYEYPFENIALEGGGANDWRTVAQLGQGI